MVSFACARDVLNNLFLNEHYGFQLGIHRWHHLELRKKKSTTKDKAAAETTLGFIKAIGITRSTCTIKTV
ncbi:hypothetical protein L1987_24139 [Smallanthus sonchifolius]|uniref:Uncharacterized protein n=1 Tax=Smallanthus sonchifolius TaxID=185202 RepID=A0ACB9IJD5_9ASTR|nr:hypothetical protein L1987_24139 [Smallanthus sonchifolius]